MQAEDPSSRQSIDDANMSLAIFFIVKESLANEWNETFFYHTLFFYHINQPTFARLHADAFCFFKKKPVIEVVFINDGLLTLFISDSRYN
jgi:hypothetical protein